MTDTDTNAGISSYVTKDVVTGIVRAVLPAVVTLLIAKGMAADQANMIANYGGEALIAIVLVLSAWWAGHRNKQAVQIAKVMKIEGVKAVTVDPAKIDVTEVKNQVDPVDGEVKVTAP